MITPRAIPKKTLTRTNLKNRFLNWSNQELNPRFHRHWPSVNRWTAGAQLSSIDFIALLKNNMKTSCLIYSNEVTKYTRNLWWNELLEVKLNWYYTCFILHMIIINWLLSSNEATMYTYEGEIYLHFRQQSHLLRPRPRHIFFRLINQCINTFIRAGLLRVLLHWPFLMTFSMWNAVFLSSQWHKPADVKWSLCSR